jgi:adenylate kinase
MVRKIKAVLLFGAPGSGKGTQGRMLGTLPGFVHIACGEVFRSIDLTSEVGKIFLKYSSRGELVPDDTTIQLWHEHIDKLVHTMAFKPQTDVLVLDGIPRNVHQAEMLDDYIEAIRLVVLRSNRDRNEIVRRLKSRALRENRLDDANEETIRQRLQVYDEESKPVINHYPAGIRVDVDSFQTPIEVAHDILSGILGRTNELREIGSRAPTIIGAQKRVKR